MYHPFPFYPWMVYVGAGLALVLVSVVIIVWFRHMMVMQSVALLGREIAASEINQVQHVICDCCHRHGKMMCYSFNHKEAWVCISCNKRLRVFLNQQPKGIKTATL